MSRRRNCESPLNLLLHLQALKANLEHWKKRRSIFRDVWCDRVKPLPKYMHVETATMACIIATRDPRARQRHSYCSVYSDDEGSDTVLQQGPGQ